MVHGLWLMVSGSGFRVWGLGFGASGFGFEAWGLGFRAHLLVPDRKQLQVPARVPPELERRHRRWPHVVHLVWGVGFRIEGVQFRV
ncbi:hypothetical protein T484DRAFT_3201540 [Baffinella frigidus]|nr:hypothetical protein T484DRAFT_3201540 [Cryptophyta sp. CCMP2293]